MTVKLEPGEEAELKKFLLDNLFNGDNIIMLINEPIFTTKAGFRFDAQLNNRRYIYTTAGNVSIHEMANFTDSLEGPGSVTYCRNAVKVQSRHYASDGSNIENALAALGFHGTPRKVKEIFDDYALRQQTAQGMPPSENEGAEGAPA